MWYYFFFFNDTATTEIYTLSLHDALPIFVVVASRRVKWCGVSGSSEGWSVSNRACSGRRGGRRWIRIRVRGDRKSTRLNYSHANISYAVFCLKKKKKQSQTLNKTLNKHSV